MEPYNYSAALAPQGPTFADSMAKGVAQGQERQFNALKLQEAQRALAAQASEAQRLNSFYAEMGPAMASGDPAAAVDLFKKYPQYVDKIKAGGGFLSDADENNKKVTSATIFNALQSGDTDMAKQSAQSRVDYLTKIGADPGPWKGVLDALNSGDPEKIAQVKQQSTFMHALYNPTAIKTMNEVNADRRAEELQPGKVREGVAEADSKETKAQQDRLSVIGQTLGSLEGKNAKPSQVELAIKTLAKRGVIAPGEVQNYIDSIPTDPKQMDDFLSQHRLAGTSAKDITQLFTPSADARLSASTSRYSTDSAAATAANRLAFDKSQASDEAAPVMNAGGPSGQEFLASIPKSAADQVKALAEGRMAFPTGKAAASPYWQKMISAVAQYDPSFDAVNYGARAKARGDLVAGKTGSNIKAINTAIAHMGQLDEQMTSLGNSSIEGYNTVANWLGSKFGNEKLQKKIAGVEATAEGVAGEMAKVFRDTGMSQHEIDAWRTKFKSSTTPAAQQGTMEAGIHMLQGRMDAIQDQYQTGMGTTAKPLDILTPDAKKVFSRLGGQKSPTPPSGIPAVGTVMQGYRFNGGNPADKSNWSKQ